jgi:predicted RNA-binding protein Jag
MYHSVSVKVKFEDDKGKLKTKTEKYLVDAMSVTEAEARVTSYMKGTQVEFEISSASQSRIVDVINPNNTPEVYAK